MNEFCIVSSFTVLITLRFVAFATRNSHCEHGCLARMQTMSRARFAEQMADKVVRYILNVESFSFTFFSIDFRTMEVNLFPSFKYMTFS